MTGEQLIPAPQRSVWDALNDPAVLKQCIPGCESIEKASDVLFIISMMASVGPVKARFKGKLAIGDADPPKHYLLSFDGSGGAAGFGKGSASVSLAPEGDGTRLSYLAKAEVGGKLAQVGSRLIDGVARKMAGDFFDRFNARFAREGAPVVAEAGAAPSSEASSVPRGNARKRWKLPIAAAIVALAVLLVFLLR